MSKVFAFSTRARRGVSQCCAARLISGNGCSGNEGRPKAPSHRRTKGKAGGGRRWKAGMRGAVALASGNEHQRTELTGNSKERTHCGARHAVRVTQFLDY